jgi:hypothetical protein
MKLGTVCQRHRLNHVSDRVFLQSVSKCCRVQSRLQRQANPKRRVGVVVCRAALKDAIDAVRRRLCSAGRSFVTAVHREMDLLDAMISRHPVVMATVLACVWYIVIATSLKNAVAGLTIVVSVAFLTHNM